MYAQKEETGVEAVSILGGDEVDAVKFGWWDEGCPGDF